MVGGAVLEEVCVEESDGEGLECLCPWSRVKTPVHLPSSATSASELRHNVHQENRPDLYPTRYSLHPA